MGKSDPIKPELAALTTPIKKKVAPSKTKKPSITIEYEKQSGPANWKIVYDQIERQRKATVAPVDVMGCGQLEDQTATPAVRRYQILLSLMLSSQTKDEVTGAAMKRLKEYGCTPEKIVKLKNEELSKLIFPVSFHHRKVEYIKETTQRLIKEYNGDVPDTIEKLVDLKGVGPKMAFLYANIALKQPVGIGVDIHVHRITNRLGWVKTNKPEETRESLEKWLPKDRWIDINPLLVGFGQTVCRPVGPRCGICAVNQLCPSSTVKTDSKGNVKKEDALVLDEIFDLSKLTVPKLKLLCQKANISSAGRKAELIERLEAIRTVKEEVVKESEESIEKEVIKKEIEDEDYDEDEVNEDEDENEDEDYNEDEELF